MARYKKSHRGIALAEENVIPGAIRKVSVLLGQDVSVGRYAARLDATYGFAEETLYHPKLFLDSPAVPIRITLFIAPGLAAIIATKIVRRRKSEREAASATIDG